MTVAPPRRPPIVPSVLPADFVRLGQEVRVLCDTGVDRIQWDVMDLMAVNPDDLPVEVDECTTRPQGQGFAMHRGHLQGSRITAGRGGPGPDHVLTAGSVLRRVHDYLRDRA